MNTFNAFNTVNSLIEYTQNFDYIRFNGENHSVRPFRTLSFTISADDMMLVGTDNHVQFADVEIKTPEYADKLKQLFAKTKEQGEDCELFNKDGMTCSVEQIANPNKLWLDIDYESEIDIDFILKKLDEEISKLSV